jgi:hypothetical protein
MKGIDLEFIDKCMTRLAKLKPDTKPAWGKLKADEMVPHLIGTLKSSMGDLPEQGFIGNWFTTTILPHIAYTGWVGPPKNLKSRDRSGAVTPAVMYPGNANDLASCMKDFIQRRDAGTMKTTRHPLFGDIGPEGWGKIHVAHCKHHFKQFQI